MKKLSIILFFLLSSVVVNATIHVVLVWDGYFQFTPSEITIQLGDTIQWLPLDSPLMQHSITSTNIPVGAEEFDEIWQLPADTFFQYIPEYAGLYEYVCTPHEVSYNMVGSFTVEDASSINEITLNTISVFPNPASNYISLREINTGLHFSIIDLNGKEVLNGLTEEQVDISNLNKGVYFIEIINNDRLIMKFIKH